MGNLAVGLCIAQQQLTAGAQLVFANAPHQTVDPEAETRFNLDFKGGSPKALVEAIESEASIPVNVIIPGQYEGFMLPPFKVRNVTLPQFFQAISAANRSIEMHPSGQPGGWNQYTLGYGFRTADERSPIRGDSIWIFYVNEPPAKVQTAPTPQCRFWQLEAYLEKARIEDITTAIETGWKMLGISPLPKLSFHKETKLLIVVGPEEQLATVDQVLRELTPGKKTSINNPPIPRRGVPPAPGEGQ